MKQSITIKLNAWIVCAVLLVTNLITIGLWQPWQDKGVSDRTISITGSTTIEAEPDEFAFNPYYQKEGADKAAVTAEVTALSNTVTAKLKELGVEDSAIKSDISSYDYGIYAEGEEKKETATLSYTITISDKDLAQKVQDYLLTTGASGSVTPYATFSTSKQKELETKARDEALKDAGTKAAASADQLGAKLGRVVEVGDVTSADGVTPLPWAYDSRELSVSSSGGVSTSIQTGMNEYTFSVEVTYELK